MTEGVGRSDSQISPAHRWAITLSVRIAALREQDQRHVSWKQRVLIEPVVPQDVGADRERRRSFGSDERRRQL